MPRRRIALALSLTVGALLAGCTPAAVTPPEPLPTSAEPVWTVDAGMLGRPEITEGVLVAYTSSGPGDLVVRGWDAETGAELWSRAATPGAGTIGEETVVNLDASGRYLAVFTPVSDTRHGLELIDVTSGEVLPLENTVTGGQFLIWGKSRPAACGEDLCFDGSLDGQSDGTPFLIDLDGRRIEALPAESLPLGARTLSAQVWSTGERGPGAELLGHSEGGEVLWQRPYEEVFGPGVSSDYGWNWRLDAENDQFIGIGATDARAEGGAELSGFDTVALDRATGETRWHEEGVDSSCAAAAGRLGYWCRYESGVFSFDDADELQLDDLDVSLERFDPADGSVLWSAPLGAAPGAVFSSQGLPLAGNDERQLVATPDGVLAITLADGSITTIDDDLLPCIVPVDYGFHRFTRVDLEVDDYPAGDVVRFCDAEGADVAVTTPSAALVAVAGDRVSDDVVVLTTSSGMIAYRLS